MVEKKSKIFGARKMFIIFGVEIFLGYSFDVEFSKLSIYEVFRVIPALLHGFWELFPEKSSKKTTHHYIPLLGLGPTPAPKSEFCKNVRLPREK